MSIKITLDNVAVPTTPPTEPTDIRLGNNLVKEVVIVGSFTATDIISYVDTNGLEVKVTEICVFTNDVSSRWAILKKGAGIYDVVDNPIVEADLQMFNSTVIENITDTYATDKAEFLVTLTQAEYDAIVTKDANTLYFIPLIPE